MANSNPHRDGQNQEGNLGAGGSKGGGHRPAQSDSDDGSRGKDDPNGTPNSPGGSSR